MPHLTDVRRVLYTDPVWSAYAIADLQPGLADSCRWWLDPQDGQALLLLYSGLTPPVLFAIGPPEQVASLLEQALCAGELPAAVYVSIRSEHEPVLLQHYDFRADRRPMLRMVRRRAEQPPQPEITGLVRLHSDDVPRLQALYDLGGAFAPDTFDAEQVADGVYFGIEAPDGSLVAAGGTHIVDWDAGIGAIGNFYTRPDARRHGYAGALLAAIVRDLHAGNADLVVLNVDQRNIGAGRLYERHGFAVHCAFIEGRGERV